MLRQILLIWLYREGPEGAEVPTVGNAQQISGVIPRSHHLQKGSIDETTPETSEETATEE